MCTQCGDHQFARNRQCRKCAGLWLPKTQGGIVAERMHEQEGESATREGVSRPEEKRRRMDGEKGSGKGAVGWEGRKMMDEEGRAVRWGAGWLGAAQGKWADNEESDGGTFVVRSLRHGRRKALRLGQELMVNYNIPHYSALDWLVTSGFVPPERYQNWQKLDAPLPRIRRDGPFAGIHDINNGNSNNAASGRVETHTPFVAYKVQRK